MSTETKGVTLGRIPRGGIQENVKGGGGTVIKVRQKGEGAGGGCAPSRGSFEINA